METFNMPEILKNSRLRKNISKSYKNLLKLDSENSPKQKFYLPEIPMKN